MERGDSKEARELVLTKLQDRGDVAAVDGRPYRSLSSTLTLQRSTIRGSSPADSGYVRDTESDDDRFVDHLRSTDAIVTSGGPNDAGMLETNLHDDFAYRPAHGFRLVSAE
jgi:hypothetical protein